MEKTHANDILPMLLAQVKDKKHIAFIKVGNGSDWNRRSMVNEYYFFKPWKGSDLDIIDVQAMQQNIQHTTTKSIPGAS